MSDLNIYQRINKIMQSVDYVKKDTTIKMYKDDKGYGAVTHDQVVSVCRKKLVENGVIIYPEQIGESTISIVLGKDGNPTNMLRFAVVYNINFVNMDNPEDRIICRIEAHANDNGDKAPGKAVTYATKTAILKVLCLETGENDEARTQPGDISTELEEIQAITDIDSLKTIFATFWKRYDGKKDVQKEIVDAYESRKRELNNVK
ncbi:MAG: ERF family protein [Candidatus Margulisiibacteriota bacterium]